MPKKYMIYAMIVKDAGASNARWPKAAWGIIYITYIMIWCSLVQCESGNICQLLCHPKIITDFLIHYHVGSLYHLGIHISHLNQFGIICCVTRFSNCSVQHLDCGRNCRVHHHTLTQYKEKCYYLRFRTRIVRKKYKDAKKIIKFAWTNIFTYPPSS